MPKHSYSRNNAVKVVITLSTLLFNVTIASAQKTLEDRLVSRVVDCNDVAYNSAEAFTGFMELDYLDSAKMVLDFWENNCGISEPVMRAKVLWSIVAKELTEELYGVTMMEYIYKYLNRIDGAEKSDFRTVYAVSPEYFGYVPLNSNFDRATVRIAQGIGRFDNDLERLYSLLYSDRVDDFFALLQTQPYAHYLVRYGYDTEIARIRKQLCLHFSLFSGAYIPSGNAAFLGTHPEFGFSIGAVKEKITYDLRIAFRWGSTDEPYHYYIYRYDTIPTSYYFGGFIGFDVFYELTGNERNKILLLGGIAIDGFDTQPYNNYYYTNYYSVLAFNANLGVMYRLFLNQTTYLFLSYRHNFVNYNNSLRTPDSGGIYEDISGNWHSLNIGIGWVGNKLRRDQLKMLRYQQY